MVFILASSIRTLFYPKNPNTINTQNNNSDVQILNSVCRSTKFCVSFVMADPLSLFHLYMMIRHYGWVRLVSLRWKRSKCCPGKVFMFWENPLIDIILVSIIFCWEPNYVKTLKFSSEWLLKTHFIFCQSLSSVFLQLL